MAYREPLTARMYEHTGYIFKAHKGCIARERNWGQSSYFKKTTMPDDSEGMQHRGTYVAPVSVWQPFNQGGQLESERAHGMLTRDLTGPAMRGAKSGSSRPLPKELRWAEQLRREGKRPPPPRRPEPTGSELQAAALEKAANHTGRCRQLPRRRVLILES